MLKKYKKQLKLILTVILIAVVCVGAFTSWIHLSRPSVYIESKSVPLGSQFSVDVKITSLPEGKYPAASIAVKFDNNKLELLGTKLGTLGVANPNSSNKMDDYVPEWYSNVIGSNQSGIIKAMYLDMSSGDKSYEGRFFEKSKKDVLLRLNFKLKDTAISGDQLKLSFDDVCFAAVEGSGVKSLSTATRTLYTKTAAITVV